MRGPEFVDLAVNCRDDMFHGIYNGKLKHPPDIKHVLQRARNSGVRKVLATGVCLPQLHQLVELLSSFDPTHEFLFMTAGIHPTDSLVFERASDPGAIIDELRTFIQQHQDVVRAFGEFGLDRARTSYCPFQVQEKGFALQMQLADYVQLPLFVHNRDASDIVFPTLKDHPLSREKGGVVHSFDGSIDDARTILDLGLDISVNGLSLKTVDNLNVVSQIPSDRLHFETDAPWCSMKPAHDSSPYVTWKPQTVKPDKYREDMQVHGRNEPANVRQVAECVFRYSKCEKNTLPFNEDAFALYCGGIAQRSIDLFRLVP